MKDKSATERWAFVVHWIYNEDLYILHICFILQFSILIQYSKIELLSLYNIIYRIEIDTYRDVRIF